MWRMHSGMGWWTVSTAIWNILFLVGLIGLVVWIVRRVSGRTHGDACRSERQDALEIAKMRYARGEITKEQFDQIKKDLTAP
ncbi:MAG: SHOCT domain-containing protein [Candidatus Bipolaricaulota bacterium]|nr:SHOCT domain-containing protein [Candidatus Bipolaricaulota bacterium]